MTQALQAALQLNPNDSVVIALKDIAANTALAGFGVTTQSAVPRGHKISLREMAVGQAVVRYGQIIGQALVPIAAGAHVHSHNLGMGPHSTDYAFSTDCTPLPLSRSISLNL